MSVRVLFLCIHNSARSQIAESYLKKFGGDRFHVESAGLEPAGLNPLVVKALKEDGIDISGNSTNDVFDFFKGDEYTVMLLQFVMKRALNVVRSFPAYTKRSNGVLKTHLPLQELKMKS